MSPYFELPWNIKFPGFFFFFFFSFIYIKMSKSQDTSPIILTTLNNKQSKVSKFLLDPWSTAKVILPAAAIQVVLHNTVLKNASLRELTLGLSLLNAFWFATTLNLSYIETPLLANVPSLDEWTKLDVGRHRFNWINKIEVIKIYHLMDKMTDKYSL